MCDTYPGELLIAHRKDDVAADTLRERISNQAVPGVSIIESLDDRLLGANCSIHRHLNFRYYRLKVPIGQEGVKHNLLYHFYRHEINHQLSRGNMSPATHGHVLNYPRFQLQISRHHILSQAATGVGTGVSFTFDPIHATYKARIGMSGSSASGSGKTVLIIDSGIDASANSNVIEERNFVDYSSPLTATDETGHGTAIKQIVHDLAPSAEIIVFKVVDSAGRASEWDTLASLAAATNCNVVNISLSFGLTSWNTSTCGRESQSSRSAVFETLIEQLTSSPDGPLVVAAAGNESDSELAFPSRFPTVAAVESVDSTDSLSTFSNRSTTDHDGNAHPNVFLAPGGEQPTGKAATEFVGTDQLGNLHCGTSFAAAYLSGLATALWSDSSNSSRDAAAILRLLQTKADRSFVGYNKSLHGNGLIQY